MKNIITITLTLISLSLFGQVKTAPEGYQYFEMAHKDSTITMKQYFMCFLKSGETRNQSDEEAAKIQEAHLAHLAKMAEEGHSCVTGPLGGEGDIRGIVIYKTSTLEEAVKYANLDPAVKAGRLVVEVRPLWAMKGAVLD